MIKISEISNSFLFEDWELGKYFGMLYDRFFHVHGIFLREFGASGNWIFGGLIFFLCAIVFIYIKLLVDMLKKSDEVLEEEIEEEEEAEAEEEYEEYSEQTPQTEEYPEEVSQTEEYQEEAESTEETAEYDYGEPLGEEESDEQNQGVAENTPKFTQTDKEQEEMEKELSADIVRTSKISDDYLNLRDVLYKQSKQNNGEKVADSKKNNAAKAVLSSDAVWDLEHLAGVIVNMLSRKVSDKKIAQSAYYLNKGAEEAEEIIQLVKAIKSFVGYCNTGKFSQLPSRESLPSCEDALYALAFGDNDPSMELMGALLNTQVVLAQRQKGLSKELSYALAADYACTLGTLANIDNYELAINSFELATELAPKNVNALSRCADMYWQDHNEAKAATVYQQVLSIADDVIYPEQKANANMKLAQYFRASGKMFKADEMEKDGRKFFDEYGVKNQLSEMEKKTLSVILDKQNENMSEYVKDLLKA